MMSEVMCLQRIAERSRNNPDGTKGCVLGRRDMAGELLAWIWGQFSSGCGRKVRERNGDNRRRGVGMDGRENRFFGVSDPTLSASEAAQRLPPHGSLPPQSSRRFPSPV